MIQTFRVNLRDGTAVPFDTFVSPNSCGLYIWHLFLTIQMEKLQSENK